MYNNHEEQSTEQAQSMSWDELRKFIASVSEEVKATTLQVQATTLQMQATDRKIAELNRKREEDFKQWKEERQKREEERQKREEEYRKKAEEERKKAEEKRQKREEEYRKKAEEERKKAEEERQKREEEYRKKAEEERKKAKEERKKAEEERKQREKEREQKRKEEIEEWNRRFEADCKATRQRLGELSTKFIPQTEHIVEGLMVPSALRTLQDAGFDIRQCCRRMRGANPRKRMNMEIDLFYMNTTEAVAVEVKTYCTKNKINHFLKQMRKFKTVFPQYEGIKVYPAVAAVDFKDDYATNPANDEDYDGDEYYEGYIDGRSAEELGLTKADGIPENETIRYAQEKGVIVLHIFDGMLTVKTFDKNGLTTF